MIIPVLLPRCFYYQHEKYELYCLLSGKHPIWAFNNSFCNSVCFDNPLNFLINMHVFVRSILVPPTFNIFLKENDISWILFHYCGSSVSCSSTKETKGPMFVWFSHLTWTDRIMSILHAISLSIRICEHCPRYSSSM